MTDLITFLLCSSAISLVGLQLCVPLFRSNSDIEKTLLEQYWTLNPLLRIFYGFSNIIGVIFVLIVVGYLTFAENWWWFLVYIGGLIVANGIAFIWRVLLIPVCKLIDNGDMYLEVKVHRIAGSILVWTGLIVYLVYLVG